MYVLGVSDFKQVLRLCLSYENVVQVDVSHDDASCPFSPDFYFSVHLFPLSPSRTWSYFHPALSGLSASFAFESLVSVWLVLNDPVFF